MKAGLQYLEDDEFSRPLVLKFNLNSDELKIIKSFFVNTDSADKYDFYDLTVSLSAKGNLPNIWNVFLLPKGINASFRIQSKVSE